ncbi:AAA family ATPase, partial [Clostridium sp. Cult3]|uniref:AAA family ATPase n=1 Tax=Clostridium sp. Cult3 TaxID=2079004 RepID=UPI001F35DDB4
MKYINKLILENFQSHKYTEIEFDSTLNVIVGPSDQGKSAIIRALKWALYNEPSGDFFIREGERDCSVTVIFNDNTKVKRFRSKSKNAYYLYDANNTEKVFEGFGTTVPQEIIDATSIRKVVLDSDQSSTINIGEQLEGPFLLSEKNSTRANAIGRLVGVHIVDDALKDTLKDIRNLNIKRKSYEDTLKDLYKNLEEYEYLDELTNKIKELDNVKQSIYCCQDKLAKLKSIQVELERLNGEIKLVEDYLTKLKDINKITALEQLLSENIKKYIYISNRYDKFNKIKTEIEHDKYLLKALKDINMVGEIINDINLYNNKINKL